MHGKICYLEIPANAAADAASFYSSIFGWKVRERGDGNLAFDDTGSVSGPRSRRATGRPMSARASTSWWTASLTRCNRSRGMAGRF